MEGRNFHTALIGGFRKKDVVAYLAEEKRLQEEQVEELRQSQAQLEQQLDEARTSGGANRLLNEELQVEMEAVRQQLELTQMDLRAAKEAQLLAENRLTQAEADLTSAEEEKQALRAENDQLRETVTELLARPDTQAENETLRTELEQQKALSHQLEEALAQARASEPCGLGLSADLQTGERLRADLAAERQRVAQLESQLRQLASHKAESGSADQLWALCGKMERTIRQMEKMLDGPYHVTYYPGEPIGEKDAAPIFAEPEELPEEPVRQPVRPAQNRSGVSSLLQRVRRK